MQRLNGINHAEADSNQALNVLQKYNEHEARNSTFGFLA